MTALAVGLPLVIKGCVGPGCARSMAKGALTLIMVSRAVAKMAALAVGLPLMIEGCVRPASACGMA
jgi:hypothetical protein